MNVVESCSKEEIGAVHTVLKKYYPAVYADIWKVGLNLSLRISDLLAIRFEDLNLAACSLVVTERKTGKRKEMRLNSAVVEIVTRRRKENPRDVWLFQAHSNRAKDKPLDRSTVGAVFKAAGERLSLKIGTHSMRKSRGAAMYADGVAVEMIAKVLNHSNTAHTLRYIGITREQVQQTYNDYVL